jgi:hypothetical protein
MVDLIIDPKPKLRAVPQGLEAASVCTSNGTAEAVPFPKEFVVASTRLIPT